MTAKQLANSMSVSEADVMCLANSVANSLEQDDAANAFLALDESTRTKLAVAYVPHAARKIEQFASTYLTVREGREALQHTVLGLLRGEVAA